MESLRKFVHLALQPEEDVYLFTPGPTPVPPFVLEHMQQPLYHRSKEFQELLLRVDHNLRWLFQTEEQTVVLTSSATGAAEAVMRSLFPQPGKHLCIVNGKFSERWAAMLRHFGHTVVVLDIPLGKSPLLEQVEEFVRNHPDALSFWIVHSETSTGALSDVEKIAALVHQYSDAYFCVDAVSSVAVHPFFFDQWGVDVAFTGSQKALMLPPGLALLAVSRRARQKIQQSKTHSWYFHLEKALEDMQQGRTPWTPAIPQILGLDAVLQYYRTIGLEQLWKIHEVRAHAFRKAMESIGVALFGEFTSHALTPAVLPNNGEEFLNALRSAGVVVAKGQGELRGKIFRVSHMGWQPVAHQLYLLFAIENALLQIRHRFHLGDGIAAFLDEMHRFCDNEESRGNE